MNCKNCGKEVSPDAASCPACGNAVAAAPSSGEAKNKTVAGILAILLGAFGIHKFYLGYTKEGVIMLAISLVTCGFGASVVSIIGIIEGIMYLTKSDTEFDQVYIKGRKAWF